jgi:hypothetical protein
MTAKKKYEYSVIQVYVSKETKAKVEKKFGNRCVSYGINKLIQKDLNEKK